MAFYSGSPTTYHSYMNHIDEIGNAWNQALEDAEDEDYSAVQLILQRTGDQYTLRIEIVKEGLQRQTT
jgi:phage terminase large subunit-like protein